MNNIFKVIFNKTTQQFVVVSELGKSTNRDKSHIIKKASHSKSVLIQSIFCLTLATLTVQNAFADSIAAGGNWQTGKWVAAGNAKADGKNSVAVGNETSASNENSVAVGNKATSSADSGIALGDGASVTEPDGGDDYRRWTLRNVKDWVLVNQFNPEPLPENKTYTGGGLAFGKDASVTNVYGIAIGESAKNENAEGISIGVNATVKCTDPNKCTEDGKRKGLFGIAIGSSSGVYGSYDAVAIGHNAESYEKESLALGSLSRSYGVSSVSVGAFAQALSNQGVALGGGDTDPRQQTNLNDNMSDAYKKYRDVMLNTLNYGNAEGTGPQLHNYFLTAGANSLGSQAVAIGGNTIAYGEGSIAIGGDDTDQAAEDMVTTTLYNQNGTDITEKTVQAQEVFKDLTGKEIQDPKYQPTFSYGGASIAIGPKAVTIGAFSAAYGVGATTTESGSFGLALGAGAKVTKDGAIALGAGSDTETKATREQSATVQAIDQNGKPTGTSITYTNFAAGNLASPGSQVSVGSKGRERQIKNVAAGAINSESTDAINGSQLAIIQSRNLGTQQHLQDQINNVGWYIHKKNNGTTVNGTGGFIGTNNTVNFMDGKGTTVTVSSKGSTDASVDVTYDVNVDNKTITIGDDGKLHANVGDGDQKHTKLTQGTNTTLDKSTTDGQTTYTVNVADMRVKNGTVTYNNDGTGTATLTNQDGTQATITGLKDTYVTGATLGANDKLTITRNNNEPNIDVDLSSLRTKVENGTNTTVTGDGTAAKPYRVNVATTDLNIANGKVTAPDTTKPADGIAPANKLVTAGDVAKAINNSGFILQAKGTNGSLIKAGDTVNLDNMDGNITIVKEANTGKVTFGLSKDLNLDNAKNGSISGLANHITAPANNTTAGSQAVNAPTATADEHKAATVGDVLNVGWNIAQNSDHKGFIKAYDTVKFVDGDGTSAVVGEKAANGSVTVKYNVKTDGTTITLTQDGKLQAVQQATPETSLTVTNGKVANPAQGDGNKFVNAEHLKTALNDLAFNVTATANGGMVKGTATTPVKAGDTIQFVADKNIAITQADKQFTITTSDTPEFASVKFGNGNDAPTISKTKQGNDFDFGGKKLTNIDAPTADSDAANKKYVDEKTFGLGADSGTAINKQLSQTITIKGEKDAKGIGMVTTAGNDGITVGLTQATKEAIAEGQKHTELANGDTTVATKIADGVDKGKWKVEVNKDSITVSDTGAITQSTETNKFVDAQALTTALGKMGFTAKLGDGTDKGEMVHSGGNVSFKAGDNMLVTRSGTEFTFATSKIPTFDSVTINNTPVKDTDAVNKKYVDNGRTMVVSPDHSISVKNTGNIYNIEVATTGLMTTDGKVTEPSTTAPTDGKSAADADKLVKAGDIAKAINNSGFMLQAKGDITTQSLVKPGSTVNLNNTDNNISIVKSKDSGEIIFGLSHVLTGINSVQVSNDGSKITLGDKNQGITFSNGNTVPNMDHNVQLHGVADGTSPNDAVNLKQLRDTVKDNATWLKDGDSTTVIGTGTKADPYRVSVKTGTFDSADNGTVASMHIVDEATVKDVTAKLAEAKTTVDEKAKALGTAEQELEHATDDAAKTAAKAKVAEAKKALETAQDGLTTAQKVYNDAGLNDVATVKGVADAINNSGFNLTAGGDDAKKVLVKPGNTVDFTGKVKDANGNVTSEDSNIKVTQTTKDGKTTVHFSLNKDLKLGGVTNGKLDNNGSVDGLADHLSNNGVAPTVQDIENNGHKAATVNDLINAGWNISENSDHRGFIKPYNTVRFVNGQGTEAKVSQQVQDGSVDVTYNINVDGVTTQLTYHTKGNDPQSVVKVGDKYYNVVDVVNGQPKQNAQAVATDSVDTAKSYVSSVVTSADVADAKKSHTVVKAGDDNIKVADPTTDANGNTVYKVSVSSNLTNIESIGNSGDGGAKISFNKDDKHISINDGQITHVASGLGGQKLADAKGDTLKNAANIGDLQNAINDINQNITDTLLQG